MNPEGSCLQDVACDNEISRKGFDGLIKQAIEEEKEEEQCAKAKSM